VVCAKGMKLCGNITRNTLIHNQHGLPDQSENRNGTFEFDCLMHQKPNSSRRREQEDLLHIQHDTLTAHVTVYIDMGSTSVGIHFARALKCVPLTFFVANNAKKFAVLRRPRNPFVHFWGE
jgi:hypothetical protein